MSFRYSQFGNEDGTGSITVYQDGEINIAEFDHVNYDKIESLAKEAWDAYKAGDTKTGDVKAAECVALFNLAPQVAAKFQGITDRITVRDGRCYFDGDEVHDDTSEHLLRALDQGDEVEWISIANFWENIANNPNEHSRKELLTWVKKYPTLTITLDGCIIAYKGVDNEFLSSFTGTATVNGETINGKIPWRPGTRVEMPRSIVKHDPSQACNVGLHVATHKFAEGWSSKVVSVKVNPRDVVSVPSGDAEKMRICRADVIEEIKAEYDAVVLDTSDEKCDDPGCGICAPSEAVSRRSKGKKASTKGTGSSQSPLDAEPICGTLTKLLTNPAEYGFEDGIKITEVVAYMTKRYPKKLAGTSKDSIRRFKARHGI